MQIPPEPSYPSSRLWLDLASERLWSGGQALTLRPKTFALLRHLVTHPGQLCTKASLLEALWPETMVSEVVLSVCIRELRRALEDDARKPRFIETVHRRGYRFIGDLPTVPPRACAPLACPLHVLSPPLPGRETELQALQRGLATALTGTRQLLLVTGEAGLGKTTLVDAFLTTVERQGTLWIGRGQCLDHYGAREAYLPILEALERLCHGPGGSEIVEILRHRAPTWLVQMPGLLRPGEVEALQRQLLGAGQERMPRELAEALDGLTAVRPLVLVLEDLHWSDYATLDALAALARRRESARLLVLGTYRPPDALQQSHPLQRVMHEIRLHGQCAELALTFLSEAAVADYLAGRFPSALLPAGLAHLVHQRTEGNPLFMVNVVEDWVRRGWVAQVDEGWILRAGLPSLAGSVPEDVRHMLEQQLDRLSPDERRLLSVGSVAGARFSAAAVAAGLDAEVIQVDEWCTGLARRRQWLETCGEQHWPDGTMSGCYRFTHALHQEVADSRLAPAPRLALHRRVGDRLEAAYGTHTGRIATELARHFEQGHDYRRAIVYLRQAADNALSRYAHVDALAHLTRALALLAGQPDTAERARLELDLQVALGPVLMAIKGYAAPEVAHAYARARELCRQVDGTSPLCEVLVGLCTFYQERAELRTAHDLGEQLLHLAQRLQDPIGRLWAHNALGFTLRVMGEFLQARTHLEQSLALCKNHTPRSDGFVFHPGVDSLCGLSETLYLLGYPDQARQRSQEALALARELAHPFSLVEALSSAARIHRRLGEQEAAQALEEASIALCREQGFAHSLAQETVLQGWDLVQQGQADAGIAQMEHGLEALRATGAEVERPWLLTSLAMAYGNVGQPDKGLTLLAEALDIVDTTGKRIDAAGLYRRQGELLLLGESLGRATQGARQQPTAEAEACFHRALTIARQQQAKTLELRAATSLSRLWQRQGKCRAARDLLAPIHHWFTEGFDTADLQDAKTLLEELER